MLLFFFALESNDDESDESDDEGSGSGFTSGSCVSSCFELSVDRVVYCHIFESQYPLVVSVEYIQGSKFPAQ